MSRNETRLRPLEKRDLAALVELMRELSRSAESTVDFTVEALETTLDAMAKSPGMYVNLVAERTGTNKAEPEIAGFISVVFYRSFFHRVGTALINELVVLPSHRGAGVGTVLVDAVRREALRRRMDEVEVGTERTNSVAQSFYRKAGFDEEYILLGMELDGPKLR